MPARTVGRDQLRRTYVVFPGGGSFYPAYVNGPLRGIGRQVRPYFTRATATAILQDVQNRLRASSHDPDGESWFPAGIDKASWEGTTLVLSSADDKLRRRLPPAFGNLYPLLPSHYWFEVVPAWPRVLQGGDQLLVLLRSRRVNWIVMENRIREAVPSGVIGDALAGATRREKEFLLPILGTRGDEESRAIAVRFLGDESRAVRSAAAHALEHMGIGSATRALIEVADRERDTGVLEMQLRALGTAEGAEQERSRSFLRRFSANGDQHVREAAVSALSRFDSR